MREHLLACLNGDAADDAIHSVITFIDKSPMEPYVDGCGQRLRVHSFNDSCLTSCSIHNPSDHPLRDAPTFWRSDRGIMERICPHGIGHPDPDGIAFIRATRGDGDAWAEGVHGCDGCCSAQGPGV